MLQNKLEKYITPDSFDYLKNVLRNDAFRVRAAKTGSFYLPPTPPEVALQLTYRCNLRCKSCMQWGKTGFLKLNSDVKYGDMDLKIIQKILDETKIEKSSLHLWGGEPLFHREWETISFLLEKDKRRITLNTNGILIKEKIDSLKRIGPDLDIVLSLDGRKEENDYIRGKGTFSKVIQNIDFLIRLKSNGFLQCKVIINTVLNEHLIPYLAEYVAKIASMNVDKLILSFPWYISDKGKTIMDNYFRENFKWLNSTSVPSWHSFRFSFSKEQVPRLKEQLAKIYDIKPKINIRLQPQMEPEYAFQIMNSKKLMYKSRTI